MDQSTLETLKTKWGYKAFLQRKPRKKASAKNGNDSSLSFNLISELHIEKKSLYENAHTRILKSLLEYNQGEFLRSFLERCGVRISIPGGNNRKLEFSVERQYVKESGKGWEIDEQTNDGEEQIDGQINNKSHCRPDCLIWMQDSFAVIIENKINGAPETERQLDNYLEAVRKDKKIFKNSKRKNIWIVYLGKDSNSIDVPSSYSLKDAGTAYILEGKKKGRRNGYKLCLATYEEAILPWLEEDVLPQCPLGKPGLTGGVMVYVDYLKKQYLEDKERLDNGTVELFRKYIKAPFFLEYREVMDFINSDQSKIGEEEKEFFLALKNYYLNEYFKFGDNRLNNTWSIRYTNSEIHIWKQAWERYQAKQHPSCDLCFVLWPYQVDDYMSSNEVDRNFTCMLRYKGNDKMLSDSINKKTNYLDDSKSPLDYQGKWTKYIFKARSNVKLEIVAGSNFFDSFVDNCTIQKICKDIDNTLNKIKII